MKMESPYSMTKLRKYQQEDVDILTKLDCAGVFNEQRTGKTPTILKTLENKGLKDAKVLIATTASSVYPWCDEYKKWLNSDCLIACGTKKQKQKAIQEWSCGLVISMDSIKETQNSDGFLTQILKAKPDVLILDEAHRIKNPKSAVAKAMFKLKKIPVRYALTGTPAPGKALEIFSILKFINPKDFTSYWKFLEENFVKEEKQIYNNGRPRSFVDWHGFLPGKQKELQLYLDTIAVQRKRIDVMPWLPAKDYTQVRLPATKQQEKYLKELKETFQTEEVVTVNVLDRIVRYRQICLDPTLIDLKGKSPKTDWIKQYIKDYPDEQIIIFSKFTKYLLKLFEELSPTKRALLIGNTSSNKRMQYMKDFQDGEFNVFLINIDAGKEAITLDAASTIIFADKYPPIGSILQAEDRFIATVKEKANKPHKIYELMIKDTFDEDLYVLLKQRLAETDVINNFKKYIQKGE